MKRTKWLAALALILSISIPGPLRPVLADEDRDESRDFAKFSLLRTIEVPVDKAKNTFQQLRFFDISWVDAASQRYYLADRSNAGIDIIDAEDHAFLHRIGGFAGQAFNANGTPDNDHSGPDGVLVIPAQHELWAGDGDSTVKVIDLRTNQIIDVVHTNGTARADEMAYDPRHHILAVVNNADDPPFITLISTRSPRMVLARITFAKNDPDFPFDHEVTGGVEQPAWDPETRRFYVSVPELDHDATKGAIAVINPLTQKVTRLFTVDNCNPAGLTLGPDQHLLIGCSLLNGQSVIMSAHDGHIVQRIFGVGGSDEVWFNPGDEHYYLAARNNVTLDANGNPVLVNGKPVVVPVLGVIDAETNKLVKTVPTGAAIFTTPAGIGGSPHSLAVNPVTNQVFVPLPPTRLPDGTIPCPTGCIAVYGISDQDKDHHKGSDDNKDGKDR
jgi:DNA-binding beta-propeller fold protein YncE